MLFRSNQRFRDFIAFELVDNEAKSEVTTYLMDEAMNGYAFVFSKGEDTEGYWGQSGAADLYSFENVNLSVSPFKMEMAAKAEKTYTVASGDMLWKIAKQFNVTVDALVKLNQLSNPNLIVEGQVLLLP